MSAKQSRHKQAQLFTEPKTKKSTCCACFKCFTGNVSESSSDIYLEKSGEATELLVEKMVVQRVPVRIFATEEDYKKMETERGEKHSPPSAKPFEKYYSTLPKTDIKTVSNTKMRPLEESAISLHDVQVEVVKEQSPFVKKPTAMTENEEQHLVSTVLNTLSSLHTLDSKGVPKDPFPVNPPRRPPDAPVNFPPNWRRVRNSNEQVCGRTMSKELTPEMKDTLLMLGSAKKPYKLQKQRLKSQKRRDRNGCSDESFSIPSTSGAYHDFTVLPRPAAYAPDCYMQQNSGPYHDMIFPACRKNVPCDSQTIAVAKQKLREGCCGCPPCNCPEMDYCTKNKCAAIESRPPSKKAPPPSPPPKKTKPCAPPPEKKKSSTSTKKKESHKKGCSNKSSSEHNKSAKDCSGCNSTLYQSIEEEPTGTQQITEIKQIKGDNLKWRIIIRHRNEPK